MTRATRRPACTTVSTIAASRTCPRVRSAFGPCSFTLAVSPAISDQTFHGPPLIPTARHPSSTSTVSCRHHLVHRRATRRHPYVCLWNSLRLFHAARALLVNVPLRMAAECNLAFLRDVYRGRARFRHLALIASARFSSTCHALAVAWPYLGWAIDAGCHRQSSALDIAALACFSRRSLDLNIMCSSPPPLPARCPCLLGVAKPWLPREPLDLLTAFLARLICCTTGCYMTPLGSSRFPRVLSFGCRTWSPP